jgi:probable F420-dependent oxidoreductase
VKVRFGFSCVGQSDIALDDFPHLVDELERLRFDSLWLPEIMLGGPFDPVVALSHAAARTQRLKLGAFLIVPGRNPVRLARELANLDRLSGGRLLLMMVLGLPTQGELLAQGVEKSERGACMDEVIPLLRELWSGETVDHDGPHYKLESARLSPTPIQQPLEMWFGGQLPGALRRAGRLSDGWMPGPLLTPREAAVMRVQIEDEAAKVGRTIDPEHFGVGLQYRRGPLSEGAIKLLRYRRPDVDPESLIPLAGEPLERRAQEWLEAGFSKFLLRPAAPIGDAAPGDRAAWTRELEQLASDILSLQTETR